MLAAMGCNGSKKQNAIVQGTVTIDGELAKQGIVKFHPEGDGPIAYGTIHKDGSFAMQIGQGKRLDLDSSEIYSGKYVATVVISSPDGESPKGSVGHKEPSPRLSATKYSDKETSNLRYEIIPGRNVISISVERAAPEQLEVEPDDQSSETLGVDGPTNEGKEDTAGAESGTTLEGSQK